MIYDLYKKLHLVEFDEVSKKESKEIITSWCDENENIKKLLDYCFKNNIAVYSCYNGKKENSYIVFGMENGNYSEVLKLMANLDEEEYVVSILNDIENQCIGIIRTSNYKQNESFWIKLYNAISKEDVNINQFEKYNIFLSIAEKEVDYNKNKILLLKNQYGNCLLNLDVEYQIDKYVSPDELVKYNNSLENYISETLYNESIMDMPYKNLNYCIRNIDELKKIAQKSRVPLSRIQKTYSYIKNNTVNKKASISYSCIFEILKLIDNKYLEKLPDGIIKYFESNKQDEYITNVNIDIPLNNQKISNELESLICLLVLNFWSSKKEKNSLMENFQKNDDELVNKYKMKYFWEENDN